MRKKLVVRSHSIKAQIDLRGTHFVRILSSFIWTALAVSSAQAQGTIVLYNQDFEAPAAYKNNGADYHVARDGV